MRKKTFYTTAGGRFAVTAALTMAAVGLAGTTVAEASANPVAGPSAGTSAAPASAAPATGHGTSATTPMQPNTPSSAPTPAAPMRPIGPAAPAMTPAAPTQSTTPAAPTPGGPASPAVLPLPLTGTTCPPGGTNVAGTANTGAEVPGPFPGGCPTDVTFAVNVGLLQITVPATAGTALTWKADEGGSIIEPLGDVTVTDNRALDAPTWAATVTSSDFTTTGASAAATIPAGDVGYWCGPLVASSDPADTTTVETVTTNNETLVPGQTVGTAAADSALLTSTTGTAAYSLTAGISVNSAEWDPTITVHVPDNAVAGTYTGTITHSVS